MSEKTREQISALMDGELETGAVFILSAMSNNEEFRQTWNRYHLIGDALRGHLSAQIDPGLTARVGGVIAGEAGQADYANSAQTAFGNRYLKPVAGFAIAASVAVVAILGVRQAEIGTGQAAPSLVAEQGATTGSSPQQFVASQQPLTGNSAMAVAGSQAGAVPESFTTNINNADSRLNRYLVNYNEYRSNAGVQGILPYVRIVAHEAEE